MKKFNLQVLQAMSGDSIFVSYIGDDNKEHNILIDGGKPNTFQKSIKRVIKQINMLDYIFVTHIDNDHIGGVNKLLGSSYQNKIQNVFFNSAQFISKNSSTMVSESDANTMIAFINKSDTLKSNKKEITIDTKFDFFGLKISFLSPTSEALYYFNNSYTLDKVKGEALISDTEEEHKSNGTLLKLAKMEFGETSLRDDPSNGASLAMLIEYQKKSILLLGDAKDSVLIPSLQQNYSKRNRLKVDYIKISHHGSKFHTSTKFLSLVECNHFIISTDGKNNKNKHPNIETLARVLCHDYRDRSQKTYFYFNYPKQEYINNGRRLLSLTEENDYNCECIYDYNFFQLGKEI